MHELETENLLLRQIKKNDRNNYLSLLSDEQVLSYCFDPLPTEEIEQAFRSRLLPWDTKSEHWLCLSIFNKYTRQFIGINGFKVVDTLTVEVGFMLLPNFRGFGYAKESLNSVIDYALTLGFKSIIANVTQGNLASIRVLETLNFVHSSTQASAVSIKGSSYDNLQYNRGA